MRLLVDTNIFLEILLEQNRAEEAKDLLRKVDQHDFFISDFALHSVGLLLLRQRKPEVFRQFPLTWSLTQGSSSLGFLRRRWKKSSRRLPTSGSISTMLTSTPSRKGMGWQSSASTEISIAPPWAEYSQ